MLRGNEQDAKKPKILTPKQDFGEMLDLRIKQIQAEGKSGEGYRISAEKPKILKGPISIDIDPANLRKYGESEASELAIEVEDVADVDIYNRFDKYYREKIWVDNKDNKIPKFVSLSLEFCSNPWEQKSRHCTLDSREYNTKKAFDGDTQTFNQHLSKDKNYALPEVCFKSKKHLLPYFQNINAKKAASCCELFATHHEESEADCAEASRGICQACDRGIDGHSEHLLIV